MTVDPVTGHLWFVFYDRRNYPIGSLQTDVYGARSTDGGLTFQNFRLSQTPFVPDVLGFLGDYNNIVAYNDVVRPCWTRMDAGRQTSVWTALVNPTLLASTAAQTTTLDLQVYPSPATDWLNIALNLTQPTAVILALRDALGRPVRSSSIPPATGPQQLTMPVQGLAPGAYILEARLGSQHFFRQVLVQP